MWLNIAAINGSSLAVKIRDDLTKVGMSGEQIEKAQLMARQCQVQKLKKCEKIN
jgi:hypothetical protein